MYAKGIKKGEVRFAVAPAGSAKKVDLAGSFNEWKPTAMVKGKDGKFTKIVTLPPGVYEYKFLVDGQWVCDPDHSSWALNPYGTFNSIADAR